MLFRRLVAPIALACTLLGGCTTPSLNPLASEGTTIADQGLIGSWTEQRGDTTYVVLPTSDAKVYRLEVVPHNVDKDGIEAQFQVVKLGDDQFLDLSPTDSERTRVSEAAGTMFVPAHCFVKFSRDGDKLVARQLAKDWLKDALFDGSQVLTHAIADKEVVITAPTAEVQAFVQRISKLEKAWDKPIELYRLKPAPESQGKK